MNKYRDGLASLLFVIMLPTMGLGQERSNVLDAELDFRGPPELVVCSQNLENYGSYFDSKARTPNLSMESFRQKEEALVQRFAKTRCDVIAVQELVGRTEESAESALHTLAESLRKVTNRLFDVRVGASNDPVLHNGFLVARDRAEVVTTVSYVKAELPKISPEQKPRLFSRGPLEVQLEVKPRGDSIAKTVSLVTFHFKSHAGSKGDPTGLQWEPYRIEMAEALRRIVENRHSRSLASGETLLVVLGDRNSHFDTASAKILEGALSLALFSESGSCRLSKRGLPLCKSGVRLPQKLFSVLTLDPQTRLQPGTLIYEKKFYWLDDILLAGESLPFARREPLSGDSYASGVVYKPEKASDHALVYVDLNW